MAEMKITLNFEDIKAAILSYIEECCNLEANLNPENLVILDWQGSKIESGNIKEITAVYTHKK